jgi:asparagine synthase (glutamine-hydrolysing)
MSGIVGILNLDGSPIDRELLWRMTNLMSFRGPDAQEIWTDENVGFGHTMLRTTWEAETEQQPLTLDGKVWLTADARIDGRAELIDELKGRLGKPLHIRTPNDAELILYAYEAWGEECIKHLIGDFAFAIWDTRLHRLFCARDYLGVRQFYYSRCNDCFVFSNTLNSLRLHPHVSNNLDEFAIGDFLVFGLNQDRKTTIFADIQRLPQAHTLAVSESGLQLHQYWTPSATSVRYQNERDQIERFQELLRVAVTDRLRTSAAGISMSGGLDSTAIAATALQPQNQASSSFSLRAYCVVYERVLPEERKYATLVADALQIPLEFLDADVINQQTNRRTMGVAPEPFDVEPFYVVSDELLDRIASRNRVGLTGWDGDTFLTETPRHTFARSLKTGNLGQLFFDMIEYVYFQRAPPPVGIRTHWKRWRNPEWNKIPYPAWLNDDFSKRTGLKERWQEFYAERPLPHPTRPMAFGAMFSPNWNSFFARFDGGATLLPLEVRHPLIDMRMVEYLLALPIIPWLLDKMILRKAMTGLLPDAVRLRPKTPLGGDPGLQLRYSKKLRDVDEFRPVPAILNFVNRAAVPRVTEESNSNQLWMNVRPYSLNQWLTNSLSMENANDHRPEPSQT